MIALNHDLLVAGRDAGRLAGRMPALLGRCSIQSTEVLLDLGIGLNPRDTAFAPLDLSELFGNDHPVVLEIGSGKGRFLISGATEQPENNFIGVEKSLHYYRVIRDRVAKRGLPNVRVINHDAFPVVQ